MAETCLLCTNIEVIFHHVHMRVMVMVMLNYDYVVVKNDDTKIG
jgi:hypothetical protein